MSATTIKHPLLPKAPLIRFERQPKTFCGKRFYARFRLANCWMFYCGYFSVTIRAPWLTAPARQLHPELFGLDRTGRTRAAAPASLTDGDVA